MENKISVIIPVYKVEKYLDRCVESVVNQTYKNLEIILVDDGSPDNCPKICDDWAKKDKRTKVIHKENGGVSSARNLGLEKATGDYIAFVDSDDWIEETMYEKLINSIIKDKTEMAICRFTYEYVDSNKSVPIYELDLADCVNGNAFPCLLKSGSEQDGKCIKVNGIWGCIWRGVYSRKLINGIEFENLVIAEDFIYFLRILLKNPKISFCDEYLYKYFQNETSVMHSINKRKIRDRFVAQNLACQLFEGKGG